jgi:hypothetical protein
VRRIPSLLLAAALAGTGLAAVAAPAPPAQAATPQTRVSIIGDGPVVSLMETLRTNRDVIINTYPTEIDGTACRGSVRSSCQNQPPAAGLPASAYDVAKAHRGSLGDVVVLMTGYSDLIASPNTPYPPGPDMTPFNKDFTTLMTELHNNHPNVESVIMLNLRTSDTDTPALQRNKYNAINDRLDFYNAQGGVFAKLSVANWEAHSAGLTCSSGSPDCFQADGITPTVNGGGARALLLFIKGAVDGVAGSPGPNVPPAVGNRCLAGNGTGFAQYSYQSLPGDPGYPPFPPPPQAPDASLFVSIPPARLFDSRPTRPVGAGKLLRIQVTNDFMNVPLHAKAVALNITAVSPCGVGFLTVFPCGPTTAPVSSNVNFVPGTNVANAVTARVGTLGRVCIYASQQTDVLVDVGGFYSSAGSGHAGRTPLRVTDTRTGTAFDSRKTALSGGSIHQVTLPVAPGTTGAALNVTALNPNGSGFMTVFPGPCGPANRPVVSNINFTAGKIVPNYVAVRVPNSRLICVYTSVGSHLLIDLAGTFGAGGTTLKAVQPRRLLDTRSGARLAANVPRVLNVVATAGGVVPGNAESALLNVTAVGPSGTGFLTVYPCGPRPVASNLNYTAGQVRPNLVDATLSGGNVCLVSSQPTHVIVDPNAYYWLVPDRPPRSSAWPLPPGGGHVRV